MTTLMVKRETAKSLYGYDHAFISQEGVEHFARIFEVQLTPYRMKADPGAFKGLRLNGGAKSAVGMDAADLACSVCRQLGVEYPDKFGRGSQLRAAVRALETHYQRLYDEHFKV